MHKPGDLVRISHTSYGNIPIITFETISRFISFKENRGKFAIVIKADWPEGSNKPYYTLLLSGKVVNFVGEDQLEKEKYG